jgi:hypothetical protein
MAEAYLHNHTHVVKMGFTDLLSDTGLAGMSSGPDCAETPSPADRLQCSTPG